MLSFNYFSRTIVKKYLEIFQKESNELNHLLHIKKLKQHLHISTYYSEIKKHRLEIPDESLEELISQSLNYARIFLK